MKRLNLIMFFFFLSSICGKIYSTDNPPITIPPIPHVQSLIIPITITADENFIAIHFNKAMGETEILIKNEIGETVYNASTNTDMSPDFFIPTNGLDNGIYTISFQYGDSILTQSFEL